MNRADRAYAVGQAQVSRCELEMAGYQDGGKINFTAKVNLTSAVK